MKVGKHRFVKKDIGPLIKRQVEKQENSPLTREFMGMEVSSLINVKTIVETPGNVKNSKKNSRASFTNDTDVIEIKSTLKGRLSGASTVVVLKY